VLWDVTFKDAPERRDERELTGGRPVSAAELLLGGFSLLLADDTGIVRQWFPVRDGDGGYRLASPRAFEIPFVAADLLAEPRRKGFLALSADGDLGVYHTTAERTLLERPLLDARPMRATLSPRADYLIVLVDDGTLRRVSIDNEHPEVSFRALWAPVWYEGYQEPVLSWQSSSASNDFEPKFSLTPLAFGTLKAALYAMLFAMPLAILGAIYTAYFMSPLMRSWVKPTIEIMEALPTVILGFLAGLWLAPLIEARLTAVLLLVLVLPVGVLGAGLAWDLVPRSLRARVPDGWQAALLVPVVCGLTWASFALGPGIERTFFGGDLQALLLSEFGLAYDQRNALVVGLAMGLAVIPTIFSIAEDAIFSVPRNLIDGSLALGATPWQTLSRVVLLTASPGIFSAVMIGFGRAVGETMIVLMATGNTPVLDLSIFQGMRTFSANIAVELPESEVNGTHYRILFLAALVLFGVTFLFNTVAELVRQRLRSRYGSL
jgi:phosphate transport system permease protein